MANPNYQIRWLLLDALAKQAPSPASGEYLLTQIPLSHDPVVADQVRAELGALQTHGYLKDLAAGMRLPPRYQITPAGLAQIEGSAPRDVAVFGAAALG